MSGSRRDFLMASGAVAATSIGWPAPLIASPAPPAAGRFECWIDLHPAAIRHNVGVLSRLAGGRKIIAVVKNNGYGFGLVEAARTLDGDPRIEALGVVKVTEALALRDAGIRKPIMLLAIFDDADGEALARHGIIFTLGVPDAGERVARAMRRARMANAQAHLYIDTGMSRMGLTYHDALPHIQRMHAVKGLRLTGMMSELTEDKAFDSEQCRRLSTLARDAQAAGVRIDGPLHAASSHGVYHHKDTLLDAVRPGITLFGGYSLNGMEEAEVGKLEVALSVRARIARVGQMQAGDVVGYGGNFRADKPTWVATVPVGHVDGYPRSAVKGGRILVNGATYPVVGTVSASHCVLLLGDSPSVAVGDVATLFGPEHPDIHPNQFASRTASSVYDVFMHLSPALPRRLV